MSAATMGTAAGGDALPTDPDWVDDLLLTGPDRGVCLRLDRPLTRAELRAEVAGVQAGLAAAGLGPGGAVALCLPPSLAYVAALLAAWRLGAQAVVLDHRLTPAEVGRALAATAPQVLVRPPAPVSGALHGYRAVPAAIERRRQGRPAATGHALVQLSSGSTGPSKVIGRHAGALAAEIARFAGLAGMPRRGERLVLLNSLVHSFGLVGGLLHGLHAGVEITLVRRHTARAVLEAVAAGTAPVHVFGVPFHAQLLAAVSEPPRLPQLAGVVSGGELTRPAVAAAFAERYGLALGEAYGMTEVGVVAADLAGRHRPAVGPPAPGVEVRERDGELWVRCRQSPYLGAAEPGRHVDGWLRTRDAGRVDASGLVTVLGRLDSQVSIGGTKVDLSEVEHTLAGLPQVREAVVVHDGAIRAYVVLQPGATAADVESAASELLAAFKRPRHLDVLTRLPRTASGKMLRDVAALRAASTGRARP